MNQLDRAMQTIVHCLLAMKKLEMENTALQEENAKLLALIKYQTDHGVFRMLEELNRAKNKLTAIREIME